LAETEGQTVYLFLFPCLSPLSPLSFSFILLQLSSLRFTCGGKIHGGGNETLLAAVWKADGINVRRISARDFFFFLNSGADPKSFVFRDVEQSRKVPGMK